MDLQKMRDWFDSEEGKKSIADLFNLNHLNSQKEVSFFFLIFHLNTKSLSFEFKFIFFEFQETFIGECNVKNEIIEYDSNELIIKKVKSNCIQNKKFNDEFKRNEKVKFKLNLI